LKTTTHAAASQQNWKKVAKKNVRRDSKAFLHEIDAMNAVAALAATDPTAGEFVDALWDTQIPSGKWRYYDGMLYTLALLHVSGNFRVYPPA